MSLQSELHIQGVPARWISEGYAATIDGFIWSFWKPMGPSHGNRTVVDLSRTPLCLKGRPNKKGYLRVQLGRSGDRYVHRLVWAAWNGTEPVDQIRHVNGDNADNRLCNLEPGDQRANEADKRVHGRHGFGEGSVRSKLTDVQVIKARSRWREGYTLVEIVDQLDLPIGKQTLHEAVRGKTWAHLNAISEPFSPGTRRKRR